MNAKQINWCQPILLQLYIRYLPFPDQNTGHANKHYTYCLHLCLPIKRAMLIRLALDMKFLRTAPAFWTCNQDMGLGGIGDMCSRDETM